MLKYLKSNNRFCSITNLYTWQPCLHYYTPNQLPTTVLQVKSYQRTPITVSLILYFFVLLGMKWRSVYSTCVFESDFGFTLNCGFKKSSLFRVRNLGGVKSYFGLGKFKFWIYSVPYVIVLPQMHYVAIISFFINN